MKDWNGQEVEVITSKGGVIALVNPYDNLISTGISPWPPSEIVQKLYKSLQIKAYPEAQGERARDFLGYYSDLQSIHSEDAMTWSAFGTVAKATEETRNRWVEDLLEVIGIKAHPVDHSEIFLWRRIPHPDTLVPGGPEIDFGIHTEKVIILGEAKWLSPVDTGQGKDKDKDQIELRTQFLNKYGRKLYPSVEEMVVLGVGLKGDIVKTYKDGAVQRIGITWDEVCNIESHPLAAELRRYLAWKKGHSKLD